MNCRKVVNARGVMVVFVRGTTKAKTVLTPAFVSHSDDGRLNDVRMTAKRVLHFRRVDIFAGHNNEELFKIPIPNVEISLLVEISSVAGAQPSVDQCLFGRRWHAPIFDHDSGRMQANFADCGSSEISTVGSDYFHTDTWQR